MAPVDQLAAALRLGNDGAALVTEPANVRWLTCGFPGEALVYLSAGRRELLTDTRYAGRGAALPNGFTVRVATLASHDVAQHLSGLCREDGIAVLHLEDTHLSHRAYELLRDTLDDSISVLSIREAPERLRRVKSAAEIASVRRACGITALAFAQAAAAVREGMTERELASVADSAQLLLGADETAFPAMASFGAHTASCHAVPGDARLRKGDLIVLDMGCRVDGYCSDMARTFVLGQPSDEQRRLYASVLAAHSEVLARVRPGVSARELDRTARALLTGPGGDASFPHGLGHGIGLDPHEAPHMNPASVAKLMAGETVAIEPGLYRCGIGGARIEDTVLVTQDGCEVLTRFDTGLTVL